MRTPTTNKPPVLPNKDLLTDYVIHNGVMVPDDLQVGDVILAKMTGSYHKSRLYVRRTVVLGIQFAPEQGEITSLHLARFTHHKSLLPEDTSFFVSKQMGKSGDIQGVDLPIVMRTNRTDFIPMDSTHFLKGQVERIGRVSPQLLSQFATAYRQVQEAGLGTQSIYGGYDPSQYYIHNLDHAFGAGESDERQYPVFAVPFQTFDDYDHARAQVALSDADRFVSGEQIYQNVIDAINARREAFLQAREARAQARKARKASLFPVFKGVTGPSDAHQDSADSLVETTPVARNPFDYYKPEGKRTIAVETVPNGRHSPQDLVDYFGRSSTVTPITLPQHLWQGRYVQTNICSLSDENDTQQAFRPCVVWKAYADKDSGELVGLELHPVTRSQAGHFKYKMDVYPLRTKSRNTSHLIADCIIRVPINSRYFHADATANFFELPPDKLARFAAKRDFVMSSGDHVHVYGLEDIPDNWVECDLPPTPSMEQFVKWAKKGHIQFDGNLTNKIQQRRKQNHKKSAGRGRHFG